MVTLFYGPSMAVAARANEANLPLEAQLQDPVKAKRPGGVTDVSWETVHATRCRVSRAGAAEVEKYLGDQPEAVELWLVVLPVGAPVRNDQRILVVYPDPTLPLRAFQVVGDTRQPSFAVMTKLPCKEVKLGL
jgi:hypothetical protein